MADDYARLLEFAVTDKQREVLSVAAEHNSVSYAAKSLGISRRTARTHLATVKRYAAVQGYAPEFDMTRPVPTTHIAKGISTLYDKEGNVAAQWVKSTLNEERYQELLKAAAQAFCDDIPTVAPVASPTTHLNSDLLNTFVITDYHFGAKSWGEETGADWDLKIAEELLVKWFAAAIKQSPDAETALLLQVGDFLHFDGLEALTPTAGHLLDADTRFQLVVRTAIRTLRCVVSMLLHKHKKVHVVMAEGNHDIASSVWLREMLCALYEDEPRITIDRSPDVYYCYEHGLTSVFAHHGHKAKFDNLDAVLTAKFREVFGRTKYSYVHVGHYHHNRLKESALMTVEQHRTLAAPDAYASRGGYISGRDAKVITYHKRFGEIGRISLSPEAVM